MPGLFFTVCPSIEFRDSTPEFFDRTVYIHSVSLSLTHKAGESDAYSRKRGTMLFGVAPL